MALVDEVKKTSLLLCKPVDEDGPTAWPPPPLTPRAEDDDDA